MSSCSTLNTQVLDMKFPLHRRFSSPSNALPRGPTWLPSVGFDRQPHHSLVRSRVPSWPVFWRLLRARVTTYTYDICSLLCGYMMFTGWTSLPLHVVVVFNFQDRRVAEWFPYFFLSLSKFAFYTRTSFHGGWSRITHGARRERKLSRQHGFF